MTSVSIVICCYNYAKYVRLAIDSALAQNWPGLEIVVVDDGSTDGSAEVIASYGERVIAVRQQNQGHVAAFNNGFAASSGDVVIFLDADDWLYPEAVRKTVEAWQPACSKVQYNLDVVDADDQHMGRRCCNFPENYDLSAVREEFERCNTYMWPVSSGNAYARAFLLHVMPLKVRRAPDGLLNTLAPLFGEIVTLSEALGCYRLHDTNQSYQGAGTTQVEERFTKRITLRRSEEKALRQTAAALGKTLATDSLLDHELVFINYRLMIKKLHAAYEGSETDTVVSLWRRGIDFLTLRPLPFRFRLTNAIWLCVLAAVPAPIARQLILLRFNRDSALKPLREANARLRAMLQKS